MSILHELWYGNIPPQEDCRPTSLNKMKEIQTRLTNYHEKLEQTFTKEQKELFEKFQNCWDEYISITEVDIFTYAFRLGAHIVFEILN